MQDRRRTDADDVDEEVEDIPLEVPVREGKPEPVPPRKNLPPEKIGWIE